MTKQTASGSAGVTNLRNQVATGCRPGETQKPNQTQNKEQSKTMVKAIATTYKPTPNLNYRGRLIKVEERSNANGKFWIWSFFLIEDVEGGEVPEEFEKFNIASSASMMPKSNARKWVQGMLGRVLEDDEEVDFDEQLVGKTYILNVGINENNKNTLDGVTRSRRPEPNGDGYSTPQRPQAQPQATGIDFERLNEAQRQPLRPQGPQRPANGQTYPEPDVTLQWDDIEPEPVA